MFIFARVPRSRSISIYLFFAFFLMQVHLIVPHHHHDPEAVSEHSHSHKHVHGHSHEKEPLDSGEPGERIVHAAHSSPPAEMLHAAGAEPLVKKAHFKIPFITEVEYLFHYPKISDTSRFAATDLDFYRSDHSLSFQLRGPPPFTL